MDHEKRTEAAPAGRKQAIPRRQNRVLALGLAAVAVTVLVVAVTVAVTIHDEASLHALSML